MLVFHISCAGDELMSSRLPFRYVIRRPGPSMRSRRWTYSFHFAGISIRCSSGNGAKATTAATGQPSAERPTPTTPSTGPRA